MADDMFNKDGTLSDRYHYRPGTTEPELRPEFADEAAESAEGAEAEEDLESKTKAELLEMAEDKGIDAKQSMNKADIIELLEEAE